MALNYLYLGCHSLAFTIRPDSKKIHPAEEYTTADTYIPQDHTLIPIEVANYESLDSIIGTHGVVDLFALPLSPTQKARRVAYRIKILRAPRNPSYFAVLVPQSQAASILRNPGPFSVTVRNPKSSGTHFVKQSPKKKKRQISYDME